MKKLIQLSILVSALSGGVVIADPIIWNNVPSNVSSGPSYGSQNPYKSDNQHKYQSNSGTKYKYDLNNPVDRVRYNADPAAKLMDNINPAVKIDRRLNQYGGGSEY